MIHYSGLTTTSYTRLMAPALSRPEPPRGERAIMLARCRERTARWMVPLPDDNGLGRAGRADYKRYPGQLGRPSSVDEATKQLVEEMREGGATIRETVEATGLTDGQIRHLRATGR